MLHFTLLLSCCSILSTANTMKVCPEEQLTLECQSSLQDDFVLEWNVYVPYHNQTPHKLYSVNGVRDTKTVEIESMVTLSFNRISKSGDLPLVSQLSINNVSMNLNEIRINCTERNNNNNNLIIQTVIHIIDSDFEYPHSSQVEKAVKKSNENNATVILEWTQEVGVSYNVSVTPNPLVSSSSGAMSQLVVLYNTSYHVTLVATLCGNNMNRTTIDVSVDRPVTCGYPFQDRVSVVNDFTIIGGYNNMDPSLEGAVLSFDCPPQHVLVGPNNTTCMGNREWEPDPRDVECKGLDRNNTQDLESRTSHKLLTTGVSSSVVAFLVISVLISATGVACGYYFMRRQRDKQSSSLNQPTPLYDDVNVLPSAVEHRLEQGLELKENVAYGTAKPTDPLYEDVNMNALPKASAVEHLEQGFELKENVAYGTTKPL